MMNLASANISILLKHAALKFASVGVINTLLSLIIIFSLKSFFGIEDMPANFIGYIAGLTCSFALNKQWTFKYTAQTFPALLKFLLVFVISYFFNIAIVMTLIHLGINNYFSHMAGIPFYSASFYLGCRHFVFPAAVTPGYPHINLEDKLPHHTGLQKTEIGLANHLPYFWYAGTAAFALSVLFYRLGAAPLEAWDEARLANNALEMAQTGLSLVTTYDWLPDHWNTKPPLLIWLMSMSIRTLGQTEFAVRLPTVLAAFATATIVFWFCSAHLKRPIVGLVSVIALYNTQGYIGYHGARSGDYDGMLALWTTAYLLAWYMYLSAPFSRRKIWLSICAISITLAFLTKTIQGLIFIPALFLYALSQGCLTERMRSKSFYVSCALVLFVCIGYYFAREQVDPGYFSAVQSNDLGGRYGTIIEGHQGGALWYVRQYATHPWMVFSFIIAGYQFFSEKTAYRRIGILLGIASFFYLIVISGASTKLAWYAIPLAPLSSMLIAIGIDQARVAAINHVHLSPVRINRIFLTLCVTICFATIAANKRRTDSTVLEKSLGENSSYSMFLRSPEMHRDGPQKFLVIQPGYKNEHGGQFYVAPTLFYVNALRATGRTIGIQPPSADIPFDFDTLILCGTTRDSISRKMSIQAIRTNGTCGMYKIISK